MVVAGRQDVPLAEVPNLVGQTRAEAERLLGLAQLKIGVVGEDETGAGAPGTVLRHVPGAGTRIGQGSEVSLMVKAPPAPSGSGPIPWEGVLRVRQTWFGDIDGAKECDNSNRQDADFWFNAETATERFLLAQNSAVFGFPSEPTLASCRDALAVAPVTRIALASLKPEKLIAVRTNLGRIALVSLEHQVGPSPATLELRYQRFIIRVLPVRPTINIDAIKGIRVKPTPDTGAVRPVEPIRAVTAIPVSPVMVQPVNEIRPAVQIAPQLDRREFQRFEKTQDRRNEAER